MFSLLFFYFRFSVRTIRSSFVIFLETAGWGLAGVSWRVSATLDRHAALAGADYVLT